MSDLMLSKMLQKGSPFDFRKEKNNYLLQKFILSFRSQETRETYLRCIQAYLDFFVESENPFSEECLILWLKYLERRAREGELKWTSLNTYTSALSSFYKFLVGQKYLESDCSWIFKRNRYEQPWGQTPSLTYEQVQEVLSYFERERKTSAPASRSREKVVLFEVIWFCFCTVGMRVSELCALKVKDWNGDEHEHLEAYLKLTQKGVRENKVYVHPKLTQKIQFYLHRYRGDSLREDPLFVVPGKMRGLSRFYVHQNLKRIFALLNFPSDLSTHSCRSFVASILQEKGVPLVEVQRLLGHRNVNTTLSYIRLLKAKEQSAAKKSPLFESS